MSHATETYHVGRKTRRHLNRFEPTPWQKTMVSTLVRKHAKLEAIAEEFEDDAKDTSYLDALIIHKVYAIEGFYKPGFTERLAKLLKSFVRR